MADDFLAKILVERQLISGDEANRLLRVADSKHCFLEQVLLKEQVYSRAQLFQILENHFFCTAVDLQDWPFNPRLLTIFPQKLASQHLVFPVDYAGEGLKVAMANPDDICARDAVTAMTRHSLTAAVAMRHEIKELIDKHYSRLNQELGFSNVKNRSEAERPTLAKRSSVQAVAASVSSPYQQLNLQGKSATVVVDDLIESASKLGASDIHVQPGEHELSVRFRLDGLLQTVATLPKEQFPAIVSRIKILAQMDVAERRIPQDGRFTVKQPGSIFDLRISILPAQFGEKAVIRLLTKREELLNLDNLKMAPALRQQYQEVIDNSQGFYLVAGPTGSGKTTTLYATLNAIDRETVNVVTLEDPIEYSVPKITQVQINEDIGLTFASGLRSVLRQDPDVVLVGEIRDVETVAIACRAALTGHKVLSTVHTNDSAQAITRLLDMGTLPYMLTATLRGVLSQRLLRLICSECVGAYASTETELAVLGYPRVKELKRGNGCGHCNQTGYKGRMAIYEYLKLEDSLHRMVLERASPYALRHAAQLNGMVTMAEFAKRAVLEGLTTVAEIQRVVLSEESKEQLCKNCRRAVSIEFAVCPFCQHVLKEKCTRCGSLIESNWEACPDCGEEIKREWKKQHCQHCLAAVDPNWELCPYCGGTPH